jgi:hypothetical protein
MGKQRERINVWKYSLGVLFNSLQNSGLNGFLWLNIGIIPHFIMHYNALHLRPCMVLTHHLDYFHP